MDIKTFTQSGEYKEFKAFMLSEFKDKPFDMKTEGKTADIIALEYKASELAYQKLDKGIKKFERLAGNTIEKDKPYR